MHQKSPRRTCGASNKGGSKKRREGGKNPGPGLAGEGRIRPWSSFIAKAKEAEIDAIYFLLFDECAFAFATLTGLIFNPRF